MSESLGQGWFVGQRWAVRVTCNYTILAELVCMILCTVQVMHVLTLPPVPQDMQAKSECGLC